MQVNRDGGSLLIRSWETAASYRQRHLNMETKWQENHCLGDSMIRMIDVKSFVFFFLVIFKYLIKRFSLYKGMQSALFQQCKSKNHKDSIRKAVMLSSKNKTSHHKTHDNTHKDEIWTSRKSSAPPKCEGSPLWGTLGGQGSLIMIFPGHLLSLAPAQRSPDAAAASSHTAGCCCCCFFFSFPLVIISFHF